MEQQKMVFSSEAKDDVSTITYGNGVLEFDVAKILIESEADTVYQGSFDIRILFPQGAQGYVYTTDMRMQTSNQKFTGSNLTVPFLYDTTGMEQGDEERGEFYLVTSIGEFSLPYEVVIKGKLLRGELGEIRNLFHFANLARINWKQARECFVSPLFPGVLVGSGKQYLESYKTLLQYGFETGKMDLAMDRFLILIHKKQEVSYECGRSSYTFVKEELPDELSIEIQRNGWGYTYAKIVSNQSFCCVDTVLKEKDFSQDCGCFTVTFDESKLHAGENRCSIVEKETDIVLCEIVVTVSKESKPANGNKLQNDMLKAGITRLYLDYRTGRRPLKECFKTAEKLLEQCRGIDELLPALYEAHLKLLRNKDNEAIWLLKNAKRMIKKQEASTELYGYFLYLLSMSGDDSQKKAADLLDEYAKGHMHSFALYWACMHKDHLQLENPPAVYRRLRMFFDEGCTSPILYLEAALLILENELLLSAITDFEVQVLLFMERYSLLSGPVCEQIYKLPVSVKKLCPKFSVLCRKHPSKDEKATAKMMSHLLMKEGYMGEDAAWWYKQGIMADCRINGLYEAYIRALKLSPKETLPPEVVRYFAFDTPLEERYLAYVYEKILKQQEKLSSDYLNRIHNFTIKQLKKGKINSSLAYLYRNTLSVEDMDENLQLQLQKLVFANELTLEEGLNYKSCIVRQRGIKEQKRYMIKKHSAVIFLYTDEYTILFEDSKGKIVSGEEKCQIRPFMDYQKMKMLLKGCNSIDIGEQLYLYEKQPIYAVDTPEELVRRYKQYLWLIHQDVLDEEFKKELAINFIQALQNLDMNQDCEQFLDSMNAEAFLPGDRPEFVSMLAGLGQYEKAYEIVCKYGTKGIRTKTLLGICQYILTKDMGYQDKLLKLTYLVFVSGKYTDEILQYLNLYFTGTHKQMLEIYDALISMNLPALGMAQRILELEIFADVFSAETIDIFRYCYKAGGRDDLIEVYLSICANDYLINGKELEDDLWNCLNRMMLEHKNLSMGSKLALLKYHSRHVESLNEDECHMCIQLLLDCLKQDIFLSFFNAYAGVYPVLEIYGEQSYVEYYSKKQQKVLIHFVTRESDFEEQNYYTEEMTEVYPGIYQKEFRIFWGDSIPYYITAVVEGTEQFCEKGQLELVENTTVSRNGRYRCINEIAMSFALSDYEMTDELMKEYELKKYLTDSMLKIK